MTTTTETEQPTMTIASEFLPRVQERLAKLNKRAVTKMSCAPVEMTVGEPFTEVYNKGSYDEFSVEYVTLTFSTATVGINGTRLLATVDLAASSPDLPRVVNTQPGVDGKPEWHWVKDYCDHCHTANRKRKTILILSQTQDDGTEKEVKVGKSCFKDYAGHSLAALTYFWDAFSGVMEEYGTYGAPERAYTVRQILVLSAAVIRENGWVPASKAEFFGNPTTATEVRNYLAARTAQAREKIITAITPEDEKVAADTDAWLDTLSMDDPSDFIRNLAAVVANNHVLPKHIGLVVAATPVRLNIEAKETERKLRPEPTNVPVTDERIRVTGTVTKVDTYYSEWGASEKMTVLDDRGFRVWGSTTHHKMERNDRVTFMARLTPSADDPTFGFFKRPTKAELLNDETDSK